jgi:hypothetical protein
MSDAVNQHIEIDGGELRHQVDLLRETTSSFTAAGSSVAAPLPADAFGVLSQGILVPAADALAARSRELLATAADLSGRMADGTQGALDAFSTLEQDAVDTFAGTEG